MDQYYIVSGSSQSGPYDLVTLVKKIRNGTLAEDALIQVEGEPAPRSAREWPILAGFFAEKKDERRSVADNLQYQDLNLAKALSNGWRFLQQNITSCIVSGVFILITLLLLTGVYNVLPESLHTAGYEACFVFFNVLLSCYLQLTLRVIRGQPIDFYRIKKLIFALKSIVPLALIVSLPSLAGLLLLTLKDTLSGSDMMGGNDAHWGIAFAGLVILVIPGLYTITLYAFAPLLVLDQGYGFWEAMGLSRKAILKRGINESSVVYMLFLINFVAGMLALIPMVLTLPITMSILCEYYEETFS